MKVFVNKAAVCVHKTTDCQLDYVKFPYFLFTNVRSTVVQHSKFCIMIRRLF